MSWSEATSAPRAPFFIEPAAVLPGWVLDAVKLLWLLWPVAVRAAVFAGAPTLVALETERLDGVD
ncbi:hypothetical protein [Stigmatella erecta]|uniref:hypothetical protein n=1 Tax=Stigmatella erecta TaxID=83460 RepID=UPI001C434315|nr:hypothetical protein [Stigmatella erecta]